VRCAFWTKGLTINKENKRGKERGEEKELLRFKERRGELVQES
jgi:hypothetical protein